MIKQRGCSSHVEGEWRRSRQSREEFSEAPGRFRLKFGGGRGRAEGGKQSDEVWREEESSRRTWTKAHRRRQRQPWSIPSMCRRRRRRRRRPACNLHIPALQPQKRRPFGVPPPPSPSFASSKFFILTFSNLSDLSDHSGHWQLFFSFSKLVARPAWTTVIP